jgi:MYXO-CTERM domain-containing protein
MDAHPKGRMRYWAVALALTFGWIGASPARAESIVNGLADGSHSAARLLRQGAPILPAPRLDNSPSVLRPADETGDAPEASDDERGAGSPAGALLLLAFIPSYYINSVSPPPHRVGWPDVVPRGTDTPTNTDTPTGTIGDHTTGGGGGGTGTDTGTIHQTPEPATLLSGLIGLGVAGLGGLRRRRRPA